MGARDSRHVRMGEALVFALFGVAPTSAVSVPRHPLVWGRRAAFSLDEAVELMRRIWTTATEEEVIRAVSLVEATGSLRRVKKDVWRVVRIPAVPKPQAPPPQKSAQKAVFVRTKYSPGECPRCGFRVSNPRRHNNQLHTREDCKLNVVKGVLES